MERTTVENRVDKGNARPMNEQIAHQVLKEALKHGVKEFCICAGSRNAPFISLLAKEKSIIKHYWFEERSAAFFALGRSRASGKPIAIITTSGTAVSELFSAIVEAHYTGVPLLIITADRPRRFRGTGAPQTIEQVGIFGHYVEFNEDLAEAEKSYLEFWEKNGPAHVNVCFEEPLKIKGNLPSITEDISEISTKKSKAQFDYDKILCMFDQCQYPFVIVSTIEEKDKEAVAKFLLELKAPVYLEGVSGLREDARLDHIKISKIDGFWDRADKAGYTIDTLIRIGGVPTARIWRDLEDRQYKMRVLSINSVPFSGLSWGDLICAPLTEFFSGLKVQPCIRGMIAAKWIERDRGYVKELEKVILEEPTAEQSLFYGLSLLIPEKSLIFLGNSLPIREWDLTAIRNDKKFKVCSSRGVCGIDGQISTFLGLCSKDTPNWALLGDLTALYDMAGPWILSKLKDVIVNIVVINNGGGKIFERMYAEKEFLNLHDLNFKPLADMWGLHYEKYNALPSEFKNVNRSRLIEIVPDNESTNRFWKKHSAI